jgi:hypothetical protein
VLYFTLFEALFGATPGKIFARLRVSDGHGRRASLRAVVLRNVLRPLDAAPNAYLVGGVIALLSPRQQRLGDHVAGTLVVRASSVAGTSRLPPLSRRQMLVVATVVPLLVYAVLVGLSYFNPSPLTIDRVPHPATNVQSIITLNLPPTVERAGSWAAGAPYRNGEWLTYHVRYVVVTKGTGGTQPCDASVTLRWTGLAMHGWIVHRVLNRCLGDVQQYTE